MNVVLAHANGFAKELYEPFIEHLLVDQVIEAVFIHDVVCQGYSGLQNKDKLGDEYPWYDSGRDIVKMIWHLRESGQMSYRPLVGIGHSMGGCQMLYAATLHPTLFQAVVAIEPILLTANSNPAENKIGGITLGLLSAKRRNHWPSREEARKLFAKSAFYKNWDARAFDLWIKHGLIPVSTGATEVKLTTDPAFEVYSFTQWVPYLDTPETDLDCCEYVFNRLPSFQIPVHTVFGAETTTFTEQKKHDIATAAPRGSRVDVPGTGHLVPLEQPSEMACICNEYINTAYASWKDTQAKESETSVPKTMTKEHLSKLQRIRDDAIEQLKGQKPRL